MCLYPIWAWADDRLRLALICLGYSNSPSLLSRWWLALSALTMPSSSTLYRSFILGLMTLWRMSGVPALISLPGLALFLVLLPARLYSSKYSLFGGWLSWRLNSDVASEIFGASVFYFFSIPFGELDKAWIWGGLPSSSEFSDSEVILYDSS